MKWLVAALVAAALSGSLCAAPARAPLPARYGKWLNEDVRYIITDEERKTFQGLASDTQRDQFIENFWAVRNPVPGSATNTFKEEHYRRIEYANAHFGRESNTPGWMTDMGRAWILFGKPTSQHPFTGYSQIYPLELWFYDNPLRSPSLPSFFYVLFYIPNDAGEYKFYRPFLDGPMRLVRGTQFNTNADVYRFLQPLGGDVAHASLSLVAGDPIDTKTYQPDMSSDMLISKIENFANDHYNIESLRARRSMQGLVTSRLLVSGKDLTVSTLVLTDPQGGKWLDYAVPIEEEKTGTRTEDGEFAVDFHYRLVTSTGTLIFEDGSQRKYPAYRSGSGFTPFQIAGRIPVTPGKYKFAVEVINRKMGHLYGDETLLSVPETGPQAWISGPLLADTITAAEHPLPTAPYQYFGYQFHPLFRLEAPANKKLHVLFQVFQPKPSDGELEYVLAHVAVRDARVMVKEPVGAADFQNQLLLKSKSLDTSGLPPGEYMLAVLLRSLQGVTISAFNQRLHIVPSPKEAPLYFVSDPQVMAKADVVNYMRGLSAMAEGQDADARDYLERSLKANPANRYAKQFLVQVYYRQHRYDRVTDLYRRSTLKDFDVSPQVMAEIALSLNQSGEAAAARTVLEAARVMYPGDTMLSTADKLVGHAKE